MRPLRPIALLGLLGVLAACGPLKKADPEVPSPSAGPLASFITAALADANPAGEPFPTLTELRLAIGDDCLRLVVADESHEQFQGLRGRSDLGAYDGMIFVFDGPRMSSFTMRGVPVALDIGWYDRRGRPVDRTTMEPCAADGDCPVYSSRSRYRLALETLEGELPAGSMAACSA